MVFIIQTRTSGQCSTGFYLNDLVALRNELSLEKFFMLARFVYGFTIAKQKPMFSGEDSDTYPVSRSVAFCYWWIILKSLIALVAMPYMRVE